MADPIRDDGRIEAAAAILLAAAGLLSAWASFQASLWGGVQAAAYAKANAHQIEATRLDLAGGREAFEKMAMVHAWLAAAATGDQRRMTFYEAHLPPEQRRAFVEWRAKLPADLAHHTPAPGDPPLPLPQIVPPELAAATAARAAADASFAEGQEANTKGDRFDFTTVLLSTVLFLAGISQLLRSRRPRIALLVVAGGLLIAAILYMIRIPAADF